MRRSFFVALPFSFSTLLAGLLPLVGAGCDSDDTDEAVAALCSLEGASFEAGDPNGHPDPFGAKAAGQARAGRLKSVEGLPQPAHGRQGIAPGDFVLANDKIAVFIEDKGLSDGYARFGGEIIALDAIGDDGKPRGLSRYMETLTGLSIEMVNPTSVSVLSDGSSGGEAVVRVVGKLEGIPFMQGPIAALFPRQYGLQAAYEFVLRPGEERLVMRVGVINPGASPLNFGVDEPEKDEIYGFFPYGFSQIVTPELGYAEPSGEVDWVGFDGGPWSFALRSLAGPLIYGISISGFSLYYGQGFEVGACSKVMQDRAEIIAGGPDYDGLREAIRRASGEAPFREVKGKVTGQGGAGVADAYVHVLDKGGAYISRARTAADGSFTVHAPPGQVVKLVPRKRGYPAHPGLDLAADAQPGDIPIGLVGALHVLATDATSGVALPVRVQVLPEAPQPETPESFGSPDEANGRLYQEFAVTGEATLLVPPGKHRVVVTRGYEWELLDTEVTVAAGETAEIPAALERSVDSTGYMCADFHIHAAFSADSDDPVEYKVRGAVADGLDIPVSSEHEWVADFQPIIEELGLSSWAFGVPSEELTTFTWGHFGVVPVTPDHHKVNAGAVDWIGKDPAEVFAAVHALPDDPVLIVNHPSGSGFGGYFSAAQLDRETGKGTDGFWSGDFDAVEVFNDSDFEANRKKSVADWFALLNHGMTLWAVGSSDSHHLRTSPVGYPRTCLWFGHDDPTKLTKEAVRDAVVSGASTISGGLFMTISGPNGERPGSTLKAGAGGEVTFMVKVQAPSFIQADTLEVIVNGKTITTEPLLPLGSGTGKAFMNQVTVKIDPAVARSWVVFHAKGESPLDPLHPGRRPFAASNPYFIGSL